MLPIRIVASLLIMITLVFVVVAQKREITEKEFDSIESKAGKLSYTGTHRRRMVSFHYEKEAPSVPSREISEVSEESADGRTRSLRIDKGRDRTAETERIRIGAVEYIRTKDKPWARVDNKSENGRGFGTWGDVPLNQKEYKFFFVGKVELNGQDVELYESRKFRNYQLSPNQNHAYTMLDRIWVRDDGRYLKRHSQTIESDGRISFDMVLTYEYPAEIKIEAPIK